MGSLTIGSLDVTTVAYIEDAAGMLNPGVYRGDLIELDFQPGAVWVPGEFQAYTFPVGLLMKGDDEAEVLGNLDTLAAAVDGTEQTITRTTAAGSASCTGVISGFETTWDFRVRGAVYALITIQVLTPWVGGGGSA